MAEFTNCSEGIPQQPLTMNFPPPPGMCSYFNVINYFLNVEYNIIYRFLFKSRHVLLLECKLFHCLHCVCVCVRVVHGLQLT